MKVSVVIPCFNERRTIEQIVGTVRSAPVDDIEIIVVDDGSTDGTTAVLKENVSSVADRIIYQPRNRGKGAALRAGFDGGCVVEQRLQVGERLVELKRGVVRVARPRDEVIDVRVLRREPLVAIEASAALELEQRAADGPRQADH